MSNTAEKMAEITLKKDLEESAKEFERIALHKLDEWYHDKVDHRKAYASLVTIIPFHWAKHATPLSVANDAEAMNFMEHACCQTFLKYVWMNYMDLDTSYWKVKIAKCPRAKV